MLKPYALRLPTATAVLNDQASYVPVRMCECSLRSDPHHTVLCGALYTACVDASGTVYLGPFSPPLAGESFDTCSKAARLILADTQVFKPI